MPKFVTVTPNPAIDRTYLVSDFEAGEVTRTESVLLSAGGKGINVARALKTLRSDVIATGFAGGLIGEQFVALLDQESIAQDFVDISPNETRTSILIVDQGTARQTVVNEPGPELSNEIVSDLQAQVTRLARGTD